MKKTLLLTLCLILVMACNLPSEKLATSTAVTQAKLWTATITPLPESTRSPTHALSVTPPLARTATPLPTKKANPTSTKIATLTPEAAAIGLVDIPNATMVYYDISGSTAAELRSQMNALGPIGFDKFRGDATTNWTIQWNWPGYGSSTCSLDEATVTYDVQVTFPRWTPPKNASPDLVSRWKNYTHLLAKHEQGHVDNFVDHYQSVTDAIKAATCETADAAGEAALAPLRKFDVDYDATTHHGATQGATFP
jgi:predicted secreted Zn-dependent protease